MSSEDAAPRSGNRTVLVVLLIVAAVLLIVGLACAGLVALAVWGVNMAMTQMTALTTTTDAFLNDLQANRVQAAYDQTSQGFHARLSREQFAALVKKYPALTTWTSRSYNGFQVNTTPGSARATVRVTLVGPNNSLSCTLVLVEEGGQWKVDDLTAP
jgi:hypothetical protein